IHDAKGVPWRESHPDLAERGVRDPFVAVRPDLRARQPCGPARQVPRVGGELVDLGRPASDGNADMQPVVHGTPCQMPQASLAFVRSRSRATPEALVSAELCKTRPMTLFQAWISIAALSSVRPKWGKPCEGNVREGRYLDESGQEERYPEATVRGEKAREEEGQGEWWSDENSEAGGAGPAMEDRARVSGSSGHVSDEGGETGGSNGESHDGEYAPERAVGPEEEERGAGWRDSGYREHPKEEEVVAEGVHGAVRLPVRPARRGDRKS